MTIMKGSVLRNLKKNAAALKVESGGMKVDKEGKQRPDKHNDHEAWFKDRAARMKKMEEQELVDARRRADSEQ